MKNSSRVYKIMYEKKRWITISILLLLSIALLIRLHQLNEESLWMDELRQVSYYQLSLSQVVQGAAEQSQPPLDYLIGHGVYKLSKSDFTVRLPAAIFGIGSVWILTMIVARLGVWPIALMVGMISALLPFNIYYSQEARPYSISILLFLIVLWFLDRSISSYDVDLKNQALLFIFTLLFLYSRALSPIIVILVFILMLIIPVFSKESAAQKSISNMRRNSILVIVVFILAIGLYTPFFLYVIKQSEKYLSDPTVSFGWRHLVHGLKEFNIIELWKIFVVQTDPITVPIALLLLLSPYFIWKMRLWERFKIFNISLYALPLLLCTHAIILKGKTDSPFRPPYAIYLLPLSLILSSVSLKGIWEITKKTKWKTFVQLVCMSCCLVLIFMTALSAIALKKHQIKSDWRGVSNYLNTHVNSKQVLIHKSLKPYGQPTFNGFPRYYGYKAPLISMGQIPYIPVEAMTSDREPVIILFKFREYYLTPDSKYPILPVPKTYLDINMEKIEIDDLFHVKKFKGFYIIRLKRYTGNFILDTYKIIETLEKNIPNSSFKVEFHLAAAALAKMARLPQWVYHLEQANKYSKGQFENKIKKIGMHINALKLQEEGNG